MIPFILAQLADGLTYRREHEANATILALGDGAMPAKALLVLAVCLVAYALSQTRYRWVRPILLTIGTGAGIFGAASNVLWLP